MMTIWAVDNPHVIPEAFIEPYSITGHLFLLLHSHFINGNHGWTLNETDAGGDLKQNRRDTIINKHCLLFICIKRQMIFVQQNCF